MRAVVDLTGKVFGLWTVLGTGTPSPLGKTGWKCRCSCGNVKDGVTGTNLTRGSSTNCGCRRTERVKAASTTHGMRDTRTYAIWVGMWNRCTSKRSTAYKHYGGRGITVDPAWQTFEAFYADMGAAPEGLTLERNEVNGNYCKSNCSWIPAAKQSVNKTTTVRYSKDGVVRCMSEWEDILGHRHRYIKAHSKELGLTRV